MTHKPPHLLRHCHFSLHRHPTNFVVGSIVGQSPQDRRYNFTAALANGAPDGVNKTMLVVNGTPLRSRAVIIPLPCIAL